MYQVSISASVCDSNFVRETYLIINAILANLERADPWTSCQKSLDLSQNPWTPTHPHFKYIHVYESSSSPDSKILA